MDIKEDLDNLKELIDKIDPNDEVFSETKKELDNVNEEVKKDEIKKENDII